MKGLLSITLVLLTVGVVAYVLPQKIGNESITSDVLGEVTQIPTASIEPTPSISVTPENTPLPTELVTPSTTEVVYRDSPKATPIATPSPTPTKEPTMKFVPLFPVDPKIVSANAGSITTLEFENLTENVLYRINLSSYSATSLSFSWPNTTTLDWSTITELTKSDLISLPIDDDSMGVESAYYSGILDFPTSKILYIYPHKSIPKLSLSLIRPSEGNSDFRIQTTGIYNANSGASYTSLPIVTRDEWGANPSTWDSNSSANIDDPARLIWYPVYYKAARIVIHHTATTVNANNPASSVRAIYLYHAYIRKWGDIGYNYIIDQNGTIYEGKFGGDETQGYHAFGAANRMSIGISLIGNFTSTTPTIKAQNMLTKLMAEKAAFYGFSLKYSDGGLSKWKDPSYTVFGHQGSYSWNSSPNTWTVNATACPGNSFVAILPTIVQNANSYRTNNFAQLKQLAIEANNSISAPHEAGTLIVKYHVPENTPESVIRSYIPSFSGISSYTISGNTVTFKIESKYIVHPYYGDSEYVVPPLHWSGYDNEYATFTPAFEMNGPEDRTKTLLKIFRLDPRVEAADVKHFLNVQ